MAAGSYQIYNNAKLLIANNGIDLDGDTFIALMTTNAFTPSVSGQTTLSQVTNELTDTDYTRQTLTSVTVTESGGTVKIDSANIVFGSNVTIQNAKYLIIFSDTATNDPLLTYVDLDTSSATGVSSTNSQFQITQNANGIFSIA
jgi:hypothetical protein